MSACELHHLFNLIGCYLNDRTHLFGEQTRIGALRCYVQINVETAAAGKCHFQKRHQQPTIGSIVVGQNAAIRFERGDEIEERDDVLRCYVWRGGPHLPPNLR